MAGGLSGCQSRSNLGTAATDWWAESAAPALTKWADYATSPLSQLVWCGVPLMLSPASMPAAWAAQPDPLVVAMGEVFRLEAMVFGGVPHALDQCVVRVRQRLLVARSTCAL